MTSPSAVLVTGSSRGLGRGVALRLAAAGHSVAIHYASNEAAARDTAAECARVASSPGQVFPIVGGNLADSGQREQIFEHSLHRLGRLDALVNNAGIAPRVRADILDASEDIMEEVLRVNLYGPYFLSQLAARHWLKHPSCLPGGAKLIFVSSISAHTASVNRGEYCISKAGLAMAAQLWAVRLAGAGIQVFELRPGIMATDMTAAVREKYDALIADGLVPQRRWGTAEDVGRAVEAILSGAFPFSTGDVLCLDGGLHLRSL